MLALSCCIFSKQGSPSSKMRWVARMEWSRSAKLLFLFISLYFMVLQAYLFDRVSLIFSKKFLQDSASLFSSMSYFWTVKARQVPYSNRYSQEGLSLAISWAMMMLLYWNLTMKQAKTSLLLAMMLTLFLNFQNYLMIQLPMLEIARRYWIQLSMSLTLGLKKRCSHSYRQLALSLSSQLRVSLISSLIVGSELQGWAISFPSVVSFILVRVFSTVESLNGCCPKLSKYRRHPPDHTSHLLEQGKFWSCSGDAQMGVPVAKVKLSILEISYGVRFLAHPKSAIFITSPVIYCFRSTFQGFKSRCIIPFTFSAMNAFTICLKMNKISWVFNDLLLSEQQCSKSPPSQYYMTISSSSAQALQQESQTLIKFGCSNFSITLISFMASSITNAFILLIFFIAYFLPLLSCTRYTVPKLPSPKCFIFLYFSIGLNYESIIMNFKSCQPISTRLLVSGTPFTLCSFFS